MENKITHFLLVEDNLDHAELIKQAFDQHNVTNPLSHVINGEEALAFLRKEGGFANSLEVDIVLLDLNLPGMSGLDVLKTIKQDSSLNSLPVVILTTSEAESDVTAAYELGANSYLVKPVDFSQFEKITNDLRIYWAMWNKKHM